MTRLVFLFAFVTKIKGKISKSQSERRSPGWWHKYCSVFFPMMRSFGIRLPPSHTQLSRLFQRSVVKTAAQPFSQVGKKVAFTVTRRRCTLATNSFHQTFSGSFHKKSAGNTIDVTLTAEQQQRLGKCPVDTQRGRRSEWADMRRFRDKR